MKNPLNCELLEHSPYSPELAPSDYHLFIQRCFNIRDHRNAFDQELKDLVYEQLANVVKNFLSWCTQKVFHHWTADKQGDYV